MLRELDIRDLVVIDRLRIEFQPGLNVLTGETGAGKSILLDALGFALGWRGRANIVRNGADMGEVTAVFDLPDDHPAKAILQDAGFDADDDLILRRTTTPEGRKTAYINDRRASGDVLRRLAETLVELHGQHDDRGLLNTRGHRALLDDAGGLGPQRAKCRTAWAALKSAETELYDHMARVAALQEEEDFLRHAVDELTALAPEPGEDDKLDTARRLMQAGQRVGEDVGRAATALGSGGAEGMIRDATRWLEGAADQIGEAANGPLSALERAMTELGEAAGEVDRLASAMSVDPGELERIEDRLFSLRDLARKHKVGPHDLPDLVTTLTARLDALDGAGDQGKILQDNADAAALNYAKAAETLSKSRARAAKTLDKAVAGELGPLKMERAGFQTILTPGTPGPDGTDAAEFTVTTNPGTPPGPLNKIASGGELSRFLLALKVSLSRQADGATMIFDEIDRGVGGATADAVGRRLAALAQGGQVLVVTHSPQVAAKGAHHWLISKEIKKDQTTSHILNLKDDARIDEIARMLSGDTVTQAARAAARELLSS